MIGIVGGVGPYAGVDVLKNIFDNTIAHNDQDYIDTVLSSKSSKIRDRTAFLMHEISENPAYNISKIILELEYSGVKVVGIPCNTAHSERIFSVILQELEKHQSQIKMVHMINETIYLLRIIILNLKT
jgi:aspartate racemase